MTQRFYILFEYKILVIHIDPKVFNIKVKKFFDNFYYEKLKNKNVFVHPYISMIYQNI